MEMIVNPIEHPTNFSLGLCIADGCDDGGQGNNDDEKKKEANAKRQVL